MAWKLVEVPDDDPTATWTDSEMIGASILLINCCGEPLEEKYNVYYRAWVKMQGAVEQVQNRKLDEDDE